MAVGQIISRAIAPGAVEASDIADTTITHAKLHTDMDLSTKTVTMPASVRGPATLTIDPAAVGDNTGLVVIAGDLQVDGTTTTINSTTMTVDDKNLVLASGASNSSAADGAGLTIDGASATMLYTHATTSFDFNKPVNVAGNLGVTGTVDGVDIATRDAVLTSTTTTAGAALPKAGGTVTGDVTFDTKIGLGGATHSTAPLNITTTNQHMRLNNGSELGIIALLSTGELELWGHGNNESINFRTGSGTGNIAMNIVGNNVGIGIASPTEKLHVSGGSFKIDTDTNSTFKIGDGGTNAITLYGGTGDELYMGANNAYSLRFKTDGNVVIDNGGNLGIGTASPQDLLHLNTLNSASHIRLQRFEQDEALVDGDEIGGIEFWANDASSFSGASTLRAAIRAETQNTSSGTRLEFWTGNSNSAVAERMRIIADGNVGIGTAAPTSKLHVENNAHGDYLYIGGSTQQNRGLLFTSAVGSLGSNYLGAKHTITAQSGGGEITIKNDSHSWLAMAPNGNVGIGISPEAASKLEINAGANGAVAISARSDGGNGNNRRFNIIPYADGGTYGGGIKLQTRNSSNVFNTALTITSTGYVGIGTEAPASKLHVTGGFIKAENTGTDAYFFEGIRTGAQTTVRIYDNANNLYIDSHSNMSFRANQTGGSGGNFNFSGGNVGIGVTASDKLDILGVDNGLTIRSIAANRPKITLINGSTTMLTLSANGTYAAIGDGSDANRYMAFKAGNVGIGNTDPTATLHVQGKINAQSIELGNQSTNSTFGAQTGYLGDFWEAGLKAVYYLGYLGSSASAAGTANWFNFYSSGHWGQYTRVMVYSINHYPSPGYSKWDINGTTVTQVEGRGSVGSVSVSQSTVSSNGHSGQPVYKYTVTLTMPSTYTQGPWFVALQGGGGGGHLSSSRTDAEADAWFTTRGGGMHLRNVSAAAMEKSPMYVTGT